MEIQRLQNHLRVQVYRREFRIFEEWLTETDVRRLTSVADFAHMSLSGDSPLHIVYVMNHVRVCGGSKIILEHCNQLVQRGHDVTIICHDPRPDWMELHANYRQVSVQMSLGQAVPDCDVIVCTVADQLWSAYLNQKAPVIHFEQGDTYIYDFDKLEFPQQESYRSMWSVPVPVLSVSSGLQQALQKSFGRHSVVLHNALNDRVFFARKSDLQNTMAKKIRILFVGAEQTTFKGIADIRAALQIVRAKGHDFEAVWVTPHEPSVVSVAEFDGELVVNPSQQRLGEIYRSCDLYVSGSYFESFPLPPLEAMTSGCAVISTQNVGIVEYGVHGENCLLVPINNVQAMADAILELLNNPDTRHRLVQAGFETARKFTWNAVIKQLEHFFYGQVKVWREHTLQTDRLRVETLPRGLTQPEALQMIAKTQSTMEEDWCLYLVQGETLTEIERTRLTRMLHVLTRDRYQLEIGYSDEIPGHPLVRSEMRLLRRGAQMAPTNDPVNRLPLRVESGSEHYFLPDWHRQVIALYRNGQFADMIPILQNQYAHSRPELRSVVIKWIVLALIELNQVEQGILILRDAIETHFLASDLFYLYGRLAVMLGHAETARSLFSMAAFLQDAMLDDEFFVDMRPMCEMYVNPPRATVMGDR